MPETVQLIVDVLVALTGLATAIIVPFLSVLVAQRLVRQDAKRAEASAAFLRVSNDAQAFRDALLAAHPKFHTGNPQEDRRRMDELKEAIRNLNTARMMVGLVFGHPKMEIVKVLHDLLEYTEPVTKGLRPDYEELEKELGRHVGLAVPAAMRPLHDEIVQLRLLPRLWRRKKKALPAPRGPKADSV